MADPKKAPKKAEAEAAEAATLPATAPARLQLEAEPPTMLDGKVHVGVAVGLRTGDRPSALVVPDVTGVTSGTSPVYLAKPLKIELNKIVAYLDKKSPGTKQTLEDNQTLKGFLTNTSVSIDSFYYKKAETQEAGTPKENDGLLLMQFALNFTKADADDANEDQTGGLIGSLTGDSDLSAMFDITSLSLRALQCGKDNVKVLQNYVDGLSEE